MSFCMHFSVHSDISFQILKAGGMSGLEDELMQHVMDVVLTTASQLQRWSGVVEPMEAKIDHALLLQRSCSSVHSIYHRHK